MNLTRNPTTAVNRSTDSIRSNPIRGRHPVQGKQLITGLNRHYDRRMWTAGAADLYGGSDFHNLGYWTAETRSRKEACENLMEVLIAFIPQPGGRILDVACGKGATTLYLTRYYAPEKITGINISERQLQRTNAPNCDFLLMDAARLGFPDASFDAVLCVEAAFHFNTRDDFLREAYRVLKPGGVLILTDILVKRQHENPVRLRVSANYLDNPGEYRNRVFSIGFGEIKIIDATNECWIASYNHLLGVLDRQLRRGKLDISTYLRALRKMLRKRRSRKYYLLVSARKPE